MLVTAILRRVQLSCMAKLRIKRVYDPAKESDGYRVLIDRLWPRGLSKEEAKVGVWIKEVAPSTELRKWFNHEASKEKEFKKRYLKELKDNPAVEKLKDIIKKHKTVTLLYSAHEAEENNATVLYDFLNK